MRNLFMVTLKPRDAEDVAKLILDKAKEAKEKSPDAWVLIHLASNDETERFAANVNVVTPETRVVIYKAAEDL